MPRTNQTQKHSWPFRQADPAWGNAIMWDRERMIEAHCIGNGATRREAALLLRNFKDGNSIANEGCLITCLAMILHRLDTTRRHRWNPRTVNEAAHEALYYSRAGISNVPLYADLVCELSRGEVQLCAKEEYLSGEKGWPRTFASNSWLIRAYRAMPSAQRRHFMIMLKTGTYDDAIASHYVVLHPDQPGGPDEDDPHILDPAMPETAVEPWRMSHSADTICRDGMIRRQWESRRIHPLQLCGVWLFGCWRTSGDRMLLEPVVASLARQLQDTPQD